MKAKRIVEQLIAEAEPNKIKRHEDIKGARLLAASGSGKQWVVLDGYVKEESSKSVDYVFNGTVYVVFVDKERDGSDKLDWKDVVKNVLVIAKSEGTSCTASIPLKVEEDAGFERFYVKYHEETYLDAFSNVDGFNVDDFKDSLRYTFEEESDNVFAGLRKAYRSQYTN